jgi:predicted ATPase
VEPQQTVISCSGSTVTPLYQANFSAMARRRSGVPQVIASTLAVPETAHRSLTDDIVAFLRPRQMLVILDNCEHVVDAVATVAPLSSAACRDGTNVGV